MRLALTVLLAIAVTASGWADEPAIKWSFDGPASGFATDGEPRFVELAGASGAALRLGVEAGDATFLTAERGPELTLGPSYAIEAWIHPTQVGAWNRLVLSWDAEQAYHLALHGGQASLYHGQADGTLAFAEGGMASPGRWVHLAGVADAEARLLSVYLNGRRVGRSEFDGTILEKQAARVGIGDAAERVSPDIRFQGYIDDLAVWHRPLTDDEIRSHYDERAETIETLAREQRQEMAQRLHDADVETVIFAERNPGRDPSYHYYADFGYACTDENEWLHGADGARLCRLDAASGELTVLLDDPGGGVRDPCVSYDAANILFSYRKGGTHHYNLYEIDADGQNLRQLTRGDWDDVEPCYLPDGGIAFCSSRCKRYVLCWLAPVATMFRCNADGGDMRMLSSGSVTENAPSVLPDGRILYTRWEYVNRDAVSFHHLWTMNPDGTEQDIYYGNLVPGGVFIDGQPIPGTRDITFVDSGSHGSHEHGGQIMVVSGTGGPNDELGRRAITPPGEMGFRDPYPVSSDTFLVAYGNSIRILDDTGQSQIVYVGAQMVHEPLPLTPRKREPVVPTRSDLSANSATLFVADVYRGRNMDGVEPGSIKKLLVLEDLPKPANYHGGGSTPIGHGGTWTLKRILGTVPVEADGSAFFEAPPMRSIYLALLDEEDRSVKQMRSFVTLQPGENRGCVGCHEDRSEPPPVRSIATGGEPSRIQPIAGAPDVFDFPRDVQPVLDRHCVACHQPGRREGGVELTGDRGTTYSLAFYNLMLHRQITDGAGYGWEGVRSIGGRPIGNDAPHSTYSSASPLMDKITEDHHGVRMGPQERAIIRLWIDTAAQYAGTYAAYGSGQIGGWWRLNQPIREMGHDWPSTAPAMDAIERRCASCHGRGLPRHVTDSGAVTSEGDLEGWMRPTSRFSRHTVFNLTRPEKSLMLMAALAEDAGGYAVGAATDPQPVVEDRAKPPAPAAHPVIFTDAADPDYVKILAHIQAAGARLSEIKRFDMAGFRPTREYVREMRRYGVLPETFDLARDAIDVYATDRAYWKSLWYTPEG